MTPREQDDIRQRTLRALARNRIPGYNFAGNFLDLLCRRFDRGGVVFDLEPGPHCIDADGRVYLAAVTFLADMALAAASRAFVDPSARTATLLLRIDFTRLEPRGRLTAEATSDGFSSDLALPQANCVGSMRASGGEIAQMSGTWARPPAPGGRALDPLPWERKEPVAAPVLTHADLDAAEKDVIDRVEQALHQAHHGGFLRHLWAPKVRHAAHGAASRFSVGLHVGNRVGHVQGGLTINLALATAIRAVPHHPVLTSVSAWYISPGQGKALTSRATVLQRGRNVAVVRTEVFAPGRKLVLEVISNHAVPLHALNATAPNRTRNISRVKHWFTDLSAGVCAAVAILAFAYALNALEDWHALRGMILNAIAVREGDPGYPNRDGSLKSAREQIDAIDRDVGKKAVISALFLALAIICFVPLWRRAAPCFGRIRLAAIVASTAIALIAGAVLVLVMLSAGVIRG